MAFFLDSEIHSNEQTFSDRKMITGLTDAISQGLRRYSIGEKLCSMRLREGMRLGGVGPAYGAFRGPAVAVGKGKVVSHSAHPIAHRHGLRGTGSIPSFSDQRKPRAVGLARRAERVRLPDRPATEDVQYYLECLDYRATESKLSALLADFKRCRSRNSSLISTLESNFSMFERVPSP
jgi:hypothetical protein